MSESPESPLSSHGSSEFADDVKREEGEDSLEPLPHHRIPLMPPAKRRKTGQRSYQSTPIPHVENSEELGDISSDTSGSIPASPTFSMPEEDPMAHEQITFCRWQDCEVRDLGNMDKLVQHIHDDHIGARQPKYACEWHGCARKDQTHASGYALKAHMRSHTKEKPFYCILPGRSVFA